MIDPEPWQNALGKLPGQAVTAVLTVQCHLDWLKQESLELRDEIDVAVAALASTDGSARIDRIVLHNIPGTGDSLSAEFAALSQAHTEWMYRLSLAGDLLTASARPRVHRLIVVSQRHPAELADGIQLQLNGQWEHPEQATPALNLVHAAATTPLTSYDINRDGPFGDADPSIYL